MKNNARQEKPLWLSFSQIETYKTCPMLYKFRYIFKVRAAKLPQPIFGQVIHRTLQHFCQNMMQGKKADLNTLLELYEGFWEPDCFADTMEERKYKQNGIKQLKNFYDKNKETLHHPLFIEKKFLFPIDDFIINGKIDRIDDLGSNKVELIDYKTGKSKTKKKVDQDLQMSIYAAAVNVMKGIHLERLTFIYLDTNESISTARTPEQISESFEEIKAVADNICAQKFEPVEGYHCNWCAYTWICPAKQPASTKKPE